MIEYIIVDLSEVLISGILGIERVLASNLLISEYDILEAIRHNLAELCIGGINEDIYLEKLISRQRWSIEKAELKNIIRNNFHCEVDGSISFFKKLSSKYDLILLSDNAKEWIEYIRSAHSFFDMFKKCFFSYEIGKLKTDPESYNIVLNILTMEANRCVFVDDNIENIKAARSVGLLTCHFENIEKLRREMVAFGVCDII